mmetsp:Transcript_13911/g.33615  ORF Transcript_13911/g.33615 Transcript_13911/m.33615 type:complete len:361 (+) Transcript_13911:123-1205(+)
MNSLQQRQQAVDEKTCFWVTVKTLPVLFVVGVITCLTAIYGRFPLRHALTQETTLMYRLEMAWFFWCLLMLVISYTMALITDPGRVPDTPAWSFGDESPAIVTGETKRTGERRSCKWCERFKPDRCHHCRVCRTCVLRMDHHCPWINNCVGFHNHKYFMLVLVYSATACWLMVGRLLPFVQVAIDQDVPFVTMFALLFGLCMSCLFGVMVSCFLVFHIWLMCNAMTTIEYCETRRKHLARHGHEAPLRYDQGIYNNVCACLGTNPMLWAFPISTAPGDGLTYPLAKTPQAASSSAKGVLEEWTRKGSSESSPASRQSRRASRGAAGGGGAVADSAREPILLEARAGSPSTSDPDDRPSLA